MSDALPNLQEKRAESQAVEGNLGLNAVLPHTGCVVLGRFLNLSET